MRALLFVICFTSGVTLMLLSGYVPRPASAKNGLRPVGTSTGNPDRATARSRRIWSPSLDAQSDTDASPQAALNDPDATEVDASPAQETVVAGESRELELAASAPVEDSAEAVEDEPDRPVAPALVEPLSGASDTPTDALDAASSDDHNAPEHRGGPTDAVQAPDSPPPAADAGNDRVLWNGWDDIVLNGHASRGDDLLYEWRQLNGPTSLVLEDVYAAKTRASGLLRGPGAGWLPVLYRFELTVIDSAGREALDQVEFVVVPAPELTVRPAATRSFEDRDGYWLGHYSASLTAKTDIALFEVSSPTQLTFTRVGQTETEVSSVSTGDRNVYEVVVYRTTDDATAVVEFLVDTEEQIPGVLRLTIQWEGP